MVLTRKTCTVCSHSDTYEVRKKCNDCGNEHSFKFVQKGKSMVQKCKNCNSENIGETVPKCKKCSSENMVNGINSVGFEMGHDWTRNKSETEIADVLTPDDRGLYTNNPY